jgi:hypothetical protein
MGEKQVYEKPDVVDYEPLNDVTMRLPDPS